MKRIGGVVILVRNREKVAPLVNEILSRYGDIIIGRMGIPYREKNINVISLIVEGDTDIIGAMTGKLGMIEGVELKSVLVSK